MAKSASTQPPEAKPHAPKPVRPGAAPASKPKASQASLVPVEGASARATKASAKKPPASVSQKKCEPLKRNPGDSVPALLQVTVGHNIRAARLAAGLTLRQVAELSGILFQYVSKIENGEKNLTLSTIDNLAKVLNVSVSELMQKDAS